MQYNAPEQIAEIDALKAAAKDMGMSFRKFAEMVNCAKELERETKPRGPINQNDEKAVSRNSDRLAEKYGTVKSDVAGYGPQWAREMRDAIRLDPAYKTARKIARAIPAGKDAIVTTKVGWQIVTISRVESAPNMKSLEKRYSVALEREKTAVANLQAISESAEKRTALENYTPKADKKAIAIAAAKVTKAHHKTMTARVRLNMARELKSANGKTAIPAGEVRTSLNPQSMSNRVARIVANIPDRKDVHPIRELPNVQRVSTSAIDTQSWRPESAFLLYEMECERECERERIREIAREKALKAAAEYDAAIAAELAEQKAARDSEYRERRKMAARLRRRNSKLKNRR